MKKVTHSTTPHFAATCLSRCLDSTRRFDSHYGGYLFNHLAHNFVVIAASTATHCTATDCTCLASSSSTGTAHDGTCCCKANDYQKIGGIQRSPENLAAKLQWWSDFYIPHHSLELAPAREVDDTMPVVTTSNWNSHLSNTIVNYPTYLKFFDDQLISGDCSISSVVKTYVPVLARGLVGSALHGIIHMGFAVEADHKGMVSEGLANMCTVYTPLVKSEAPLWLPSSECETLTSIDSPKGIIDTARAYLEEAHASNVYERVLSESSRSEYVEKNIGIFQRKVLSFTDPSVQGVAEGLNKHFPIALADVPSLQDSGDATSTKEDTAPLLRDIMEAQALITAAHLASDGEFFVIHGVTSLHAVLVLLPHLSPTHQRDILGHWLQAVLAVYVSVNFPGLPRLIVLLEAWQKREAAGSGNECTKSVNNNCNPLASNEAEQWSTRLSLSQLSTDEHVSKAVYVMWRWSHMYEQIPDHSLELFRHAADHQVRPLADTGEVNTPHSHLWFSS